jgi:hypothetical protein
MTKDAAMMQDGEDRVNPMPAPDPADEGEPAAQQALEIS